MSKALLSGVPKEFISVAESLKVNLPVSDMNKLYDYDLMPEDFVPFMAYSLGVFYEGVVSGNITADWIKNMRKIHDLKGTESGLEQALALIPSISSEIEMTGACLASIVITPEGGFTETIWQYLAHLIDDYKRASCHMAVKFQTNIKSRNYIGVAVRTSRFVRIPATAVVVQHEASSRFVSTINVIDHQEYSKAYETIASTCFVSTIDLIEI